MGKVAIVPIIFHGFGFGESSLAVLRFSDALIFGRLAVLRMPVRAMQRH